MTGVQRIGVQLVGHVGEVGLEAVAVVDGVLGHQVGGHVARRRPPRVANGCLRTAEIQTATHAQLWRDLVGGPDCAAVARCERWACALAFGAFGTSVDFCVRHPHVGTVDFPLGRQATGNVDFCPRHMALARQHGDVQVGVGVALVELGRMEHRKTGSEALVGRVDFCADFDVAARLRRRVDRRCAVRIGVP